MIDRELADALRPSFAAALRTDDPVAARRQLLDAGWLDALGHDDATATSVVFRLQGVLRRDAAALDDVIVRRLARDRPGLPPDMAIAHPVATGGTTLGTPTHVVLPAQRHARRVLWVADLTGAQLTVVETAGGLGDHVVQGVDPAFGFIGLTAPPPGTAERLPDEDGELWRSATAAGRVALAFQMTAGAHAVLQMAVAYARERRQFDQPIAAFQAVKHRLAETAVAVAAADAAAIAAAGSQHPTAAAVAKALAGRAAVSAAKNCLQVFGGIGVTTEHDFHRYMRRNLALDRLLCDHRSIQRELGRRLRAGSLDGIGMVDLDLAPRVDPLAAVTT